MMHRIHKLLDQPRPWRWLLPSDERRLPVVWVEAADGQRLALRHIPARHPRQAPPVVLVHGLGSNHEGFHLEGRSLAAWLADEGFDVWLPELRGHGDSTVDHYDWDLDDYLALDIPAILSAVREASDAEEVFWIGHSMGGVLLMCYGILNPDAPIAGGIAVGSALDYTVGHTGFRPLLALRPVLERLVAVPWGTVAHLAAPILGRGLDSLEEFNVWSANIEPDVTRRIHARAFNTIPVSLLASLATTFEEGGLRMGDGFRFVEHAGRLSFPIKLLAGSRDVQVSVEAVRHTAGLLAHVSELAVFGREHGHAREYGHFDLLVGRNVETEVWADIRDWLERLCGEDAHA